MDDNKAARILQCGVDRGADFVEIFEEESRDASVIFRDGKVESANAGTAYGIGLRLIYGTEVLYTYSSNDDTEHLLKQLNELAASRGNAAPESAGALPPLEARIVDNIHPVEIDPRSAGQAAKLQLLRTADAAARAVSAKVAQVQASATDKTSHVAIYNSEGLKVEDTRTLCRFHIQVTAQIAGQRFQGSESPGEQRGFEFFEELDVEGYSRVAAQRALRMLTATYIEGGQMPVVMGNAFGGVIFHEACGHPLETEMVRFKASPFTGKIGEKIAHEAVTAIDDGTLVGRWGSINIDDEGMPAQRTVLIKDGILQTYLADRVGSAAVGVARSGSGRRESYRFAPVSRMRNTYIDNGPDSLDDMIASVDHGLYAHKMGGGSVDPSTGEFNFAVTEGYRIRDGKVAEPVRGASLIGKGHEILPRISMVGGDLDMAAGMCGASSGSVPVTVGQPCLKVDSILVGGR